MTALLEIRGLHVNFRVGRGFLPGRHSAGRILKAVDGVNLEIERGESVALVGESGSGKSTLARAIVGLLTPAEGEVVFNGESVAPKRTRAQRRLAQMVFQDPTSSLNPAMTVRRSLLEPMLAHGHELTMDRERRCRELLEMVELPSSMLHRRPREMSGGQRQRVAIARALALEPELLIADEAVAALDVSVQAAIIGLLRSLQRDLGLSLLFVSHDLAVVRQVADRVLVMYLGTIVEDGLTEILLGRPEHPYTQALLVSAPRLSARAQDAGPPLGGEPPSPLDVPTGCRFHPRCPIADEGICSERVPVRAGDAEHSAACHFAFVGANDATVTGRASGGDGL